MINGSTKIRVLRPQNSQHRNLPGQSHTPNPPFFPALRQSQLLLGMIGNPPQIIQPSPKNRLPLTSSQSQVARSTAAATPPAAPASPPSSATPWAAPCWPARPAWRAPWAPARAVAPVAPRGSKGCWAWEFADEYRLLLVF